MGFSSDSGYIPASIETIMLSVMDNVNTQFGTSYSAETFIGTNFYKYFYALVQRLQENEVKTSEIFIKLQQYFRITNEIISRPALTNPGILEQFSIAGYTASIKKPIDADAGKVFICVDTDDGADDYATTKLAICNIIKRVTAAGTVSQGTEVEAITLSNGQSFDFKFNLPNRIPVLLRLTVTLSENNQLLVGSPDDVKAALFQNILARYRLGKNFEPQRYFGLNDAPWASNVLLEWSVDAGGSYASTIFEADYDDLFTISLANIEIVED